MSRTGKEPRRIVYVAEHVASLRLEGQPRYFGHCEIYGSEGMGIEEGPGWEDLDEALAWARARATIVILRVGPEEQTTYSAGAKDPEDEDLPRWPDRPVEP